MTHHQLPVLCRRYQVEVVVFEPKHLRKALSGYVVSLNGLTLASSTTVRNRRVIFVQSLFFNSHIKRLLCWAVPALRVLIKAARWHVRLINVSKSSLGVSMSACFFCPICLRVAL